MKHACIFLALQALVALSIVDVQAQDEQPFWRSTNGPEGGYLDLVIADSAGNFLVKSLWGSLHRSTDEGVTWGYSQTLASNTYGLFTASDGAIYAGGSDAILRSDDNGETFTSYKVSAEDTTLLDYNGQKIVEDRFGVLYALMGGTDLTDLYRSIDSGRTWTLISPGRILRAGILAIGPNNDLYVAATRHNQTTDTLLRVSNADGSWDSVAVFEDFPIFQAIEFLGANHIFLGTNRGLLVSRDAGATWDNAPDLGFSPKPLAVAPNGDVFVGSSAVWKSSDSGQSWRTVLPEVRSKWRVGSLAVAHNNTLLCGSITGVYRSTDAGETWSPSNTGLVASSTTGIGFTQNGDVITSLDSTLYKERPNGWEPIGFSAFHFDKRPKFYDIILQRNGNLFAGYGGGIQRSTDNGNSWDLLDTTINTLVTNMAVDRAGTLYARLQFIGVIIVSRDNGASWQECDNFPVFPRGAMGIGPDNAVYSGGIVRDGIGSTMVAKSRDQCRTWEILGDSVVFNMEAVTAGRDGRVFFGSGSSRLYKTDDLGQTIAEVSQTGREDGAGNISKIVIDPNNVVYIENNGVFRSGDGGDTWETIESGLRGEFIRLLELELSPTGYLYAGAYGDGVFRSRERTVDYPVLWGVIRECEATSFLIADDSVTDVSLVTEASWNVRVDLLNATPAPNVRVRVSLIDSDREGFWKIYARNAAGRDTTYTGFLKPYRPQATLLRKAGSDRLEASGGYIYQWFKDGEPIDSAQAWFYDPQSSGAYSVAVTDTGGCTAMSPEYHFTVTGVDDRLVNVGAVLERNAPNPFSAETTIAFTMTQAGHARVTVSDMMGREVARLVDGYRPLGRHTVQFSAAGLPAGMYQCRLETPDGIYHQTMMALR